MDRSSLNVAVIGATGAVGREMLAELEHYGIDCRVGLFASARSAGAKLKFRGEQIAVRAFEPDALKGYQYALMSAGGDFSKTYAQGITAKGCTVIDNSSAWRMVDGVALVMPEINPHVIQIGSPCIIANPNCSTVQLVMSLKPLADRFGLSAVNVSTYQSVSGSGQAGIEELQHQIQQWHDGVKPTASKYAVPIFNNLIPAIDKLDSAGHCFEEEKMIRETRKILGNPRLPVLATTVRVPVFKCHSESVTVTLEQKVTRQEVLDVMAGFPGLRLLDEDQYEGFAYPLRVVDQRDVLVARTRLPFGQTTSDTVQYWNVADNLKKGAATNAVQILMKLIEGR